MSHPNCTLLMLTLNGSKPMIKYCKSSDVCRRKLLFQDFDHPEQITKPCILCHCCDVCATNCYCELCAVSVNMHSLYMQEVEISILCVLAIWMSVKCCFSHFENFFSSRLETKLPLIGLMFYTFCLGSFGQLLSQAAVVQFSQIFFVRGSALVS